LAKLDTLAQKGTEKIAKPLIVLTGKGSDLSNDEAIKVRAKQKLITQKMILSLIDVFKNDDKQSDQLKLYWNTYHCLGRVFTENGKMYSKYCKNRCCTLCCSIHKAEIINKYLPVVMTWSDPHFVTLTIKAVPQKALKKHLEGVLKAFHIINERIPQKKSKRRHDAANWPKIVSVYFNPVYRTYNPHLHLIVQNKDIG
jgi:hypothetical protein